MDRVRDEHFTSADLPGSHEHLSFNKRLRRLPVVNTLLVRVRDACRCVFLCVSGRHGDG